jgi:hypothetical protein
MYDRDKERKERIKDEDMEEIISCWILSSFCYW